MRYNAARRENIDPLEIADWTQKWLPLKDQQFGSLTVVALAVNKTAFGQSQVICQCVCGWFVDVPPFRLREGNTTSCGCAFKQGITERNKARATHNMSSSTEYKAWQAIKNRCLNPDDARYKWYGARGITICDRWKDSFENFLLDVGRRPSKQYSIDRIDNNKGYEPSNVRWASAKEQARNQTQTRLYIIEGTTKSLGEWCEQYKMPYDTVIQRIDKFDWPIYEALTEPPTGGAPRRTLEGKTDKEYMYGAWLSMIGRCHNPTYARYKDYGERGIQVCEKWRNSFDAFFEDVGLRPSILYTLDRIDVNGNYEPRNVRWATAKEQNRNRRSTKLYELNGESKTLAEWAELAEIPYSRVKQRVLTYKWDLSEALGTPIGGSGRMPKSDRVAWKLQ